MIKRKIYNYLTNFFKEEKKSLLVTGARQVGKTFAIRKTGKECFEQFIELNFVEQPQLKTIFGEPNNAREVLLRLSAFAKKKLIPGKTLIFFDEVQECPEIVTAIKFLVDEGSYRYVMSGSLLGVELNDLRSVPVGYMTEKEMFPLDFEEFALSVGMSDKVMAHLNECFVQHKYVDEVVHKKMLELVRLYLVIGGMPSAVMKYLTTNNLQRVRDEQESIIRMYYKDIAKHDPNNKLYIKEIFDTIPSELNAKNKRFIMKTLNQNAKYERFKNSFIWLADAGVALPVFNVDEPRIPLRLNEQRNLFKLFLNDIGLLACCYTSEFQLQIITGETNVNFGAIFENFIAQELKAHGYRLHYFNSKSQGELDFVIEHENEVIPIEVKSGKDYKRHNALSNVMENKDYNIQRSIVFSSGNIELSGKVSYMPVYMIMYLKPAEISQPVFVFQPM